MTGFSLEKLSAFLVDGAMGMVWIGFWYIAVVTGCIVLVPMQRYFRDETTRLFISSGLFKTPRQAATWATKTATVVVLFICFTSWFPVSGWFP
jgi:hypothetical protein